MCGVYQVVYSNDVLCRTIYKVHAIQFRPDKKSPSPIDKVHGLYNVQAVIESFETLCLKVMYVWFEG